MTNGSFSAPLAADLTKEIQSFVAYIPAGAGVAQVVNPSVPVQGVTAYNYTANLVRATVTFTAGITTTGAAAAERAAAKAAEKSDKRNNKDKRNA